jgi:hypothetical protein
MALSTKPSAQRRSDQFTKNSGLWRFRGNRLHSAARTKKEKKKKKNMQNSGLRLSDTVCTAPLGPKMVRAPILLT